jgi:DNA polymerase-1
VKRALIIDVSSIAYRFFYKLLGMKTSTGFPTSALYGLTNVLISSLGSMDYEICVACLDSKRSSLKRKELLESYKSDREKAPEDLIEQISVIEELLESMGIFSIKKEGYEADDLIYTFSKYFSDNLIESYVITGDKDLLQLVPNSSIILENSSNSRVINSVEEVKEILGVYPENIKDLFALQGDKSDSIPGVKGIGNKGAIKLINNFGNLDDIYANIDNLPTNLKEKLEENQKIAYISRDLATLNSVDIKIDIEKLKWHGFTERFLNMLERFEFRSIIKRLNLKTESTKDLDIKIKDVSNYKLKEKSYVIFKDQTFYIYNGIEMFSTKSLDTNGHKIDTYNAKTLYKSGLAFDLDLDIMIIYHLLTLNKSSLSKAIERTFNIEVLDIKEELYYLKELAEKMIKDLKSRDIMNIYEKIEKPLIPILSKMEQNGVSININSLKTYESDLKIRIDSLKNNIISLAGEDFNIASPKQLSFILFEKLGMPVIKKSKSGFSTDVDVLNYLTGYDIVNYILEYRKLNKIYTTYVVALQKLVVDGKLHTTYHQDGTATGRLSSSNPNLQNIPSGADEGIRVRESFVSRKGSLLILDYSQIELRILAYFSKDTKLIEAYKNSLDLHYLTAKTIFNKDNISRAERSKAKVVNFSIIYGKSAFGLAKELDISISEANNYIEKYFFEYSGVKDYMDSSIALARDKGYVETLFGRRRYLPNINSKNRILRNASERMVLNTIIQGTQAEIIKKAMIDIDNFIKDKDILLTIQVHDELVFELSEKSIKYVKEIVNIMKNAVSLENISFEVSSKIVSNWAEAK